MIILEENLPTKKEWLKSVHNIGNGNGRGRISKEGHALIEEAIKNGVRFKEPANFNFSTGAKVATDKPTDSYDPSEVRRWAISNGIEVPARGRISGHLAQRYLDAVPKEERHEKPTEIDMYRDGTPRAYPEGQTFTVFYTDLKGKSMTMTIGDRCVCMTCRVSLGHCHCLTPGPVAIGSEDSSKPIIVKAN